MAPVQALRPALIALAGTISALCPIGSQAGAAARATSLARRAPSAGVAPLRDGYAAYVAQAGQRFGLPESWLWAVLRAESGGDPRAVSTAGARGLMQIMPGTWTMLAAHNGLGDDPFDARANIFAGAAFLRAMLDRYGDPAMALAAYNAGPARVDAWRSIGRPLPVATINYVARIAPAMGKPGDVSRAVGPPSWRNAALFAGRSTASEAGEGGPGSVDVEPTPIDSSAAPQAPPQRSPARQVDALFVRPSGSAR